MASADWYTPGGVPATGASGSSSAMRGELGLIETALDKLPELTGNADQHIVINAGGTALTSLTTAALAILIAASPLAIANSATNTVTSAATLQHTTSETVAAGFGTGLDFVAETTAGNEIGMTLAAVSTNVGSGTEAFDYVVNLMDGGATAAEVFRVTSTGVGSFQGGLVSGTTIGNLTLSDGQITDSSGAISFGNENLSTTGTVSTGQQTINGSLLFSGANPVVRGNDTDGTLVVSSGNASNNGSNIVLFANSHATQANDFVVRASGATVLNYDHSATSWNFQSASISGTGTLSIGTTTVGSTAAGVTLNTSGWVSGGTTNGYLTIYGDVGASNGLRVFDTGNVSVESGTFSVTRNTNERAIEVISSATSEDGIRIDHNGNGIALNIDSEATTRSAINAAAPTSAAIMFLGNQHGSAPNGIDMQFTSASPDNNTQYFFRGVDSTTTRIFIYSDGDLANHDGVYGTISDRRLKDSFMPIKDGGYWNDFKKLNYQSYLLKSDMEQHGKDAKRRIGLVADEVAEIFPSLVREGTDGMMFVKSSIIDGVINSIVLQEAMNRIEGLEEINDPVLYNSLIDQIEVVVPKIELLESKVEKLEQELAELKAA